MLKIYHSSECKPKGYTTICRH